MASAAKRKKNCVFCKTSSPENNLGVFHDDLPPHNFHSNCLIFSSNIRQNKDRTKGINGFEKTTIDLILSGAKNRICTFCKKKGATLKCSGDENSNCKISFHLPCALKSRITLHEYFGGYKSYCLEHISRKCRFDDEPITGIAFYVDCCKQLYSHDKCLEKYVLKAKSQSKCPVCEKVEDFIQFMETNFDVKIRTEETSSDSDTDINSDNEWTDFESEAMPSSSKNRIGNHEKDIVMIRCSKCKKPFGVDKTPANMGENSEWRCQTCDMGEDLDEPEAQTGSKRKRKPEKLELKKKKR